MQRLDGVRKDQVVDNARMRASHGTKLEAGKCYKQTHRSKGGVFKSCALRGQIWGRNQEERT